MDHWIQTEQPPVRMMMQVHDELVFEVADGAVDEAAEQMKGIMQGAAELQVPILVDTDVGDHWDEAH